MENYKVIINICKKGRSSAYVKANCPIEAEALIKKKLENGEIIFDQLNMETKFEFEASTLPKEKLELLQAETMECDLTDIVRFN